MNLEEQIRALPSLTWKDARESVLALAKEFDEQASKFQDSSAGICAGQLRALVVKLDMLAASRGEQLNG